MGVLVGMTTFDCLDPQGLGAWWAERTGGKVVKDHGFLVMVSLPQGGTPMLGFHRVDNPTPGKNKVHLDMASRDRKAEVAAWIEAGAKYVGEHSFGGLTWTVLEDPEGNQCCISGYPGQD
jgi:hypothetical protein